MLYEIPNDQQIVLVLKHKICSLLNFILNLETQSSSTFVESIHFIKFLFIWMIIFILHFIIMRLVQCCLVEEFTTESQTERNPQLDVPTGFEFIYDVPSKFYKAKVERTHNNGSIIDVVNLSDLFMDKIRALAALVTSDRTEIALKHPGIKKICVLKIEDDGHGKLSEFLSNCICEGVNRIKPCVLNSRPNIDGIAKVSLEDLTDETGCNMLMLAAKENCLDIIIQLCKNGFDSNNINNQDKAMRRAVDYAWINYDTSEAGDAKNEADKILLYLLKQNSVFPKDFNPQRASEDVINIMNVSKMVRSFVLNREADKLINEIKANEGIIHFYDNDNKSLITYTLELQNIDMLKVLESQNIVEGDHEDNYELREKLSEKFEILRNRNVENSIRDPNYHLHVLKSKTRIASGQILTKDLWDMRDKALEFLCKNKDWFIVLQVAVEWKRLKFIIDFSKISTDGVDPESNATTTGVIYETGEVIVGAFNLISGKLSNWYFNWSYNSDELRVYGTILHELGHCAILVTFMNNFNPYPMGESRMKNKYIKIFNKLKKRYENGLGVDEIVNNVFKYPEEQQHSELIVRVLQMEVTYYNNSSKLKRVREEYAELYAFFYKFVLPEFKNALPVLQWLNDEQKPIKFEDLTNPMQARILHSTILHQGVETTFFKMFAGHDELLKVLSSKYIHRILLHDEKFEIFQNFQCTSDKIDVLKRKVIHSGTMLKNFNQLLKKVKTQRIFILSADAGAGKTIFIENIALKIKRNFPSFFVALIKLNQHHNILEKLKNLDNLDINEILMEMLDIKDGLKASSYQYQQSIGKVVYIFDEFDSISSAQRKIVMKIFKHIQAQGNNYLCVLTRPHLKQYLEKELSAAVFEFVPIAPNQSSRMLKRFLKIYDDTKNSADLMSFLKLLESKRFQKVHIVNCPMLHKTLAKIYAEDATDFQGESPNLYKIMEKCINELQEAFYVKCASKDLIVKSDIKAEHVLALMTIFGATNEPTLQAEVKNLTIMKSWRYEQDKIKRNHGGDGIRSYNEEVQRKGFYSLGHGSDNQKFTAPHTIFAEFYFVNYLTKYLFTENDEIRDEEYIKIFNILRLTSKSPTDFKIVHRMLFGYITDNQETLSNKMTRIIFNDISNIIIDTENCEFTDEAYGFWSEIFEITPNLNL